RLSDPRRCEKSGNQDSGVPTQEEVGQGVVRCRDHRGVRITGLHIKEKNEIREDFSERRNIEMILAKKIKIEVSEEDARTLEFMPGQCRRLSHWRAGRLRDGERWPGSTVAQ